MSSKPGCLDDFETFARQRMAPSEFAYYSTGADDEVTLRRNREAFDRLLIRPKVLVNVENVDTTTTILGHTISSPICVAPTSLHAMAHHDGEYATARACAALKTCYCQSSYSNFSMEDVMAEASKASSSSPLHWFQLYVQKNKDVTEQLVRRCEKAGFKALVVTVDRPVLGRRLAETRSAFQVPNHLKFGNFRGDQEYHDGYFGYGVTAALTWDDIAWLKSITKLPIVLKGVMRSDDAEKAVRIGVDGIVVSNHGGRQLDQCPATIEMLPEIVKACRGSKVEVYVDGGIRRGTDVFKALALGAKAVFLGRSVLWGLVYNGEEGVKQVLTQITADLQLAMALAGCTSVDKISLDYVAPVEDFNFSRFLAKL